jgi:putative membrane protein
MSTAAGRRRGDESPDPASQSESADPNQARDHLANERTYLAWLRTALAVMVFGLAIAQFSSRARAHAVLAGLVLLATGLAGLGYATVHYRQVSARINAGLGQGYGRPGAAIVVSAVLALAVLTALGLMLSG